MIDYIKFWLAKQLVKLGIALLVFVILVLITHWGMRGRNDSGGGT